jgi:hypothetical protein
LASHTIKNVYELILLLKQLKEITGKDTKWEGDIVMLPVKLDKLYYIGLGRSMVYKAFLGKKKKILGSSFNEFIPEFWEFTPNIELKDVIWLFKTTASGPFMKRYKIIDDSELISQVEKEILDFIKESKKTKQKLNLSIKKLGKNPPKWKTCNICLSIPDSSYAYWKGGELEGEPLPYNEIFLNIVGAPTFNDITSYRHWCIKKCSQCHTYYHWDFTYDYYANGSEDEITFTRIDKKDESKWLKKVEEKIKSEKKK